MRIITILIINALLLFGCSYHWQTQENVPTRSYEETVFLSNDSIGRLRRLAFVPIELNTYRTKEKGYKSFNLNKFSLSLEKDVKNYLEKSKGYEVIAISDNQELWDSRLASRWENSSRKDIKEKVIQEIGALLNVDGVLVITAKELEPWDAADGIMNIFMMNIPLFSRIGKPSIGAWIYESTNGKLVWSEEKSTFGDAHTSTRVHSSDLISLFNDLANAIPKLLIE